MQRKPITAEGAMLRMASLCARSEQCEFDIRRKLAAYGLPAGEIGRIIEELEGRSFLDNGRYARSFARDKVRFSAWGRYKIRAALAAKRISAGEIAEALQSIEPADYADAVRRALRAKANSLRLSGPGDDPRSPGLGREERVKLYRHLLGRGFESDVALDAIREFIKSRQC